MYRRCLLYIVLLKKWTIPGLFFFYLRLFNTVDSEYMNKILPMTGFELQTSSVGSNHSTNWATTAVIFIILFVGCF